MLQALENLAQTLKNALMDLGLPLTVRTAIEQWEGSVTPQVEVIISVGRDPNTEAGPVADIYLYPGREHTCGVEVEVTLPAHTVSHLQPAELWSRAKEIAGVDVGISGIQRYFRGESGQTVHIQLESHFIIDYWFEVEVPDEGEASDEEWDDFAAEVSAIAQGVAGLLALADEVGGR
ncbi:MAG: hypothetical protein DIU70_005385 [Bacillota bacterium]